MNPCLSYGLHPTLNCLQHGPIGPKPCEPCQLAELRALLPKAQKIIKDLADGDVANVVAHSELCPGDDTCDPLECQDVAAMNAVMGWRAL